MIHALFNNYQKAEDYFLKHGYLITFWKDYVVCGDEYINCLDLYGNETVVVEIKDDKLE